METRAAGTSNISFMMWLSPSMGTTAAGRLTRELRGDNSIDGNDNDTERNIRDDEIHESIAENQLHEV